MKIDEGNPVRFKWKSNNVFYGFVFIRKGGKDNIIDITAYDQLRYLKNKDTYVYTNKRADEVVKMIANDFALNLGHLENTGYIIDKRVEDNKTLFDMIQNSIDLTVQNNKELYVLYDDFGKLRLSNIERMKIGLVIDEETAENYNYQTSIDTDTYNQIKLAYDNKETGKREIYIAKDSSNINKWGLLQYFEKIQQNSNGQMQANVLLQLYNQKTRQFSVKNVLGDTRVRAGSMIIVNMKLFDVKLQNFMLVEKAKHIFKNNEHFMDLDLIGANYFSS